VTASRIPVDVVGQAVRRAGGSSRPYTSFEPSRRHAASDPALTRIVGQPSGGWCLASCHAGAASEVVTAITSPMVGSRSSMCGTPSSVQGKFAAVAQTNLPLEHSSGFFQVKACVQLRRLASASGIGSRGARRARGPRRDVQPCKLLLAAALVPALARRPHHHRKRERLMFNR